MFGYPASGDWLSSDFAYDENDAFMAPDKSEDPADDDDDDAQETHCGRYPDGEEERGGKYRPPPYSFAVKTESAWPPKSTALPHVMFCEYFTKKKKNKKIQLKNERGCR